MMVTDTTSKSSQFPKYAFYNDGLSELAIAFGLVFYGLVGLKLSFLEAYEWGTLLVMLLGFGIGWGGGFLLAKFLRKWIWKNLDGVEGYWEQTSIKKGLINRNILLDIGMLILSFFLVWGFMLIPDILPETWLPNYNSFDPMFLIFLTIVLLRIGRYTGWTRYYYIAGACNLSTVIINIMMPANEWQEKLVMMLSYGIIFLIFGGSVFLRFLKNRKTQTPPVSVMDAEESDFHANIEINADE